MNVYNKGKHGFIVLHALNPPTLLMVEKAYGKHRRVCWVQCLPFQATEASVRLLAENTKRTAQCLATLYGRLAGS
jgi:hypothetical protein